MNRAHGRGSDGLGGHRPRDAEVRHLHLAVPGNNHVLRLDIPVYNVLLVGRRHALGHLDGDADGLAHVQPALFADVIFERDALDELHHDIVKNALVHDVVDADHVGVGKPGSRLGLDLKFADKTGVVAELSL